MLIARRRAISTAGRPRAASQKVAIGSRMQKAHSPTIATSSRVWSGVCVDSGFEGSWRCETKLAAGSIDAKAPEAKTSSAVKIRRDFGGFSWHGEYKLEKTDASPAMSGVFQVSYDPSSKQATFVSYDSMGAAMLGAGPISAE